MTESKQHLYKGIFFVIMSSLCMCFGEYFWKISGANRYAMMQKILFILLGLGLCALGGYFIIQAYRLGDLSVIQPMNSISYIFSTIISVVLLGEVITVQKVIGILLIILGVIFIGGAGRQ
jgi:uncharacterized membrane protein